MYVYHMWIDGDGHVGNGGNDVDDGGDSVDEITTTRRLYSTHTQSIQSLSNLHIIGQVM